MGTLAAQYWHTLLNELINGPFVLDIFAIGDRSNALLPELGDELVVGAFAVKHDDKTMQLEIGIELLLCGLLGHAGEQLWHLCL